MASEILPANKFAAVAQLVERLLAMQEVAGSKPVSRSNYGSLAQLVEQSAVNRCVVGSSPTRAAMT